MTAPLSPDELTRHLHEATTVVRPVQPPLTDIRRRAAARRRRRRVITLSALAPVAAAASVAAVVLIGPGTSSNAGRVHVRELPGHNAPTAAGRHTADATPGPSASTGPSVAPAASAPNGAGAALAGGLVAAQHYLAPDERGGLSIYAFHGGVTKPVVTPAADWTGISTFVTDEAGWVYYVVDTKTSSEIHALRMSDEHVVKLAKLQNGGDPNNNIVSLAVSRDGRRVAYAYNVVSGLKIQTTKLVVLDTRTQKPEATLSIPLGLMYWIIGFSPDDRTLYYDNSAALFQQQLPPVGSTATNLPSSSVLFTDKTETEGMGLGRGTVDGSGNLVVDRAYPQSSGASAWFHDLLQITPHGSTSRLSGLSGFEVLEPQNFQWVGNGDGTLVVQLDAPCGPGATVALVDGKAVRVDVPSKQSSCG